MGGNKKDPAGDKLVAHDEAEGTSEAGRNLFRELCAMVIQKGKRKELSAIKIGRVLHGQRRVTRDLLVEVMDLAEILTENRPALWERYFGGPPTSIAEGVRRRIILTGGIRDYSKQVDLSHPSLSWIMNKRATTADSLFKIITKDPDLSLPWKDQELMTQWRHEHEGHLMREYQQNLFAARVNTLFQMRPTASHIGWVRRDNIPASLKDMSKKKIRILLSALRHGESTPWEDVDRVLFGMDCTLVERVEVALAWLQVKIAPPPPRTKRETKTPEKGGSEDRPRDQTARLPDEPIPQNSVPYPTELADQPELEIIKKLLQELQTTDEKQGILVAEVSAVLREVEAINPPATNIKHVAPPETSKAQESPSVKKVEKKTRKRKEPPIAVVEKQEHVWIWEKQKRKSAAVVPDTSAVTPEQETDDIDTDESVDIPWENPETTLFGPPKDSDANINDWGEEDNILPDFTKVRTVWLLAEYLENFIARESAGYDSSKEAFLTIAAEVNTRAPLHINDTVNAMKMLMYCYGRAPESKEVAYLIDAIERSIGNDGDGLGTQFMALLSSEKRFRMFLLYYRDTHPESRITKLFSSLIDLATLETPETFKPYAMTDKDKDYHERLRPTPVKTEKKKKRGAPRYKHVSPEDADSTNDDPWEDD